MMLNRGRFIVICGIDGSGKTTQEELLVSSLQHEGRRVHSTRSPSDWYRKHPEVRSYLDRGESQLRPDSLAILSAADRMLQNDLEIVPALERGDDVVCNRYIYSTFAYFKQRGADMLFVESINSKVAIPDKGILMTVDPAVAVDRIRARDGDKLKYEERDPDYLRRVQEELIARWPSSFLLVDGALTQDSIRSQVINYVRS